MRERKIWFDLNNDALTSPQVAVVGMPFDGSASRRRGAALAPARLRELSRTADPVTRKGRIIEGMTLRDFGDVPARGTAGNPLSQGDFLEAAFSHLNRLPKDCFLISLGGDNSISIASIRSFVRRHGPEVGVIWFDAHPDLFRSYDGNPDSHACALRRAMDLTGLGPLQVLLIGTRSFSREEARLIHREGIQVITAKEWMTGSAEWIAEKTVRWMRGLSAIYLAVDIDGFDASCAPGTGYPMPGGIGSEAYLSLQDLLFERLPVRALDLTEIAPPLDTNDITGFLGIQIILEAIGSLGKILSAGDRSVIP